jgi:hypothetical protein
MKLAFLFSQKAKLLKIQEISFFSSLAALGYNRQPLSYNHHPTKLQP